MSALSVCLTASREATSVRALLSLVRPIADEVVVGVDARAADAILAACADLIDRPLIFDYEPPPDRYYPWLHHQCSGDWILRLDDDELPGTALLELLPELARDRRRTNVTGERDRMRVA
jgi:hypothetical protein